MMRCKHRMIAQLCAWNILLLMGILLCGCEDSPEQQAINEQVIAQATENAIHYIEQKYGFTPTVTNTILERQYGMFGSSPLTTVLLTMAQENESFYVYMDGKTENTDGADDYQLGAIEEGIQARLRTTNLPACTVTIQGGISSPYDSIEGVCRVMFTATYTGDNLAEVLGTAGYGVYLRCVAADVSCITPELFGDLTKNEKTTVTCISYRSEEAMETCKGVLTSPNRAIYIARFARIEKGAATYVDYPLETCGNFTYYVESKTPCTVKVSPCEMVDAANWNGRGAIDGTFVSQGYSISSTGACSVYLAYPRAEIPKYSQQDTCFAVCRETTEGTRFSTDSSVLREVGDYLVYELTLWDATQPGTVSFAMLQSK